VLLSNKKSEAFNVNGFEMVINFEELDALLMTAEIDPGTLETIESN
jgi:iron only hydrogenase large subunit-like protein